MVGQKNFCYALCLFFFGSNLYLYIFFGSDLYPVSTHFFCITALDRSKTWNPVTTAILDVPTAFAFFGANARDTLDRLDQVVQNLTMSWNCDQAIKNSVRFSNIASTLRR